MRYLAILILFIATLLFIAAFILAGPANTESIRWMQPDYEKDDTFEYRVVSVEVEQGWQPLKELWNVGEIRGAVVEPLVSMTVEARTTRDGVTGAVSEELLYVPEPGGLGLLAGIGVLWWMRGKR